MDRYRRVEKARKESAINENEIRITTQGLIRNYVSYASTLLLEKKMRKIVLKAMGQAISKTVAVAEIIKKRNPTLHQDTKISSTSITDVWEPIEEGLVPLEMIRNVSMISIYLSFLELNTNSPGYQAPLYPEKSKQDSYGNGRGDRGRGRGHYGSYGGYGGNEGGYGGGYQVGYGRNQGGYGGRNRGGYGGNRGYRVDQGGYGGNQGRYGNNQGGYGYQDNGGWNSNLGGRGGGRGRGNWSYRDGGYKRGGSGRSFNRG